MMITRVTVVAVLFTWLAGSCALADEPLAHTKDSLETVQENLKTGKAVMVDVRELSDWNESHLAGAIHLPLSKLRVERELTELLKKLPKDKTIYVHCRSGGRALSCGEILKQQGYEVRPLKQGTQELLKAGFEKGTKD
jgi:rhodanese-related sulfurtransferase